MDKLMLVCLFGTVLGMLSIWAISKSMQPQDAQIDELSESDIGRIIAIRGRISGMRNSQGSYFFSICQNKCLSVAIFQAMASRMQQTNVDLGKLENGDWVAIEGVVESYKDSLSIELLNYRSLRVQRR
ncbi:MAG: exodeoxyribonuclease VII large subunit [Candidatus Micrarchaeota archaeon]